MKRGAAIIFLTTLFFSTALSQIPTDKQEEVQRNVIDCINDVNDCDCQGFEDEGKAYCNKLVNGGMACMANFSKPECQEIDPTKIVVNGVSLKKVVEDKVLQYDEQITSCVTGGECDCSEFPESVRAFCEDKKRLERACLQEYDLEACKKLDNPKIRIFPEFTPSWIVSILDPIIRPLVESRQKAERDAAVGSSMKFIGQCFADPYNCDCSPIKYSSIRADCMQRARLMKTCLEYRDCMLGAETNQSCTGKSSCEQLVNMPVVPEVTPEFMKPMIKPEVMKNVCPMMEDWPYDKGNYAQCTTE